MQIVGFRPALDGPASLVIAEAGSVERRPLDPGRKLSLTLGSRHCAGALTDGAHEACDEPTAPYCNRHTDRWPCARCTGDCDYPVEACCEPHVVYLAAFAPATFKVGVTREWRLETRLREQGADRGAQIRSVEDGRRARRVEAGLAEQLKLADQVRVPTKIEGLHRSVDEAAWTALLSEFDVEARFEFEYGHGLQDPAVPATLAAGTVRGTQGRILLLERAATTYAVDLRELVGYHLREGAPSRDLQSGLGAFE